MEFNDISKSKLLDDLTDEEIEFLTSRDEKAWDDVISSIKTYSAEVEAIKEINPIFKGKTLKQLNDDKDFLKALQEYRDKYPVTGIIVEPGKITAVLKSSVPQQHIKPANKLANQITNDIVDIGEVELVVSTKNSKSKTKKEISTKVMLNYENENVQMSTRVKFTAYDREVYDGVTTLYEAGNHVITPAMVYRAMNGLTETDYISKRAVDKVKESLDKSSRIRTVIDYTDEAKMYNQRIDKTTYEGYLITGTKLLVETGGTKQEAYRLSDKPILYEYAQISGQILSVPISLLNTKATVNSTEDVIIIRGYLIRQIEWMKNEKSNRSNNITYQGIYDELEIFKDNFEEKAYKEKTFKIRSHVKSILESWQIQSYISNFTEYKEGKQIKGIKINFSN